MMHAAQLVLKTLRSKEWILDCAASIPDLATAFDIQDTVTNELAKDLGGFGGYKIAMNSNALMQDLGLPHPAAGRIFANQVYASGVKLDVDDYENLMLEPEIAAILSADIHPGDVIEVDQIVKKIDRFAPAFEILNRRNVEGMNHIPTIIAHNIFNAGVVLGSGGVAGDQVFDMTTDCQDNGQTIVKGANLAPQSPLAAASFLIRHFTGRGQVLPAGSILLLGTHCPLYAVKKGRALSLDMGALGQVSFST